MTGQVVSDIVARSGRPNDDYLLSDILLCGLIHEGMDDLTAKLFL
jgi:hypothetical protein